MRESTAFEGGALFAGKQKIARGKMGHRIAKHIYTDADVLERSTYYILDAQGNTMSTYERVINSGSTTVSYTQTEKHIYGSSRLGVHNERIELLGSLNATYSMENIHHHIGDKTYELTNHLGNVLSVVSDKLLVESSGTSPLIENNFNAVSGLPEFVYANNFNSSLDGFSAVGTGALISLNSGRLRLDVAADQENIRKTINTTIGKKYRVTFTADLNASGPIVAYALQSGTWAVLGSQNCELDGTYSYVFTATTSTTHIDIESAVAATPPRTFYIDDFLVEDVTGLTTIEPFYGTGGVIVTLENDRLKASNVTLWRQPQMKLATVIGRTYKATCTIDLNSGGNVAFFARDYINAVNLAVLSVPTNGTHSIVFTASSNETHVAFQNPYNTTRTYYLDDFKIEDITGTNDFSSNYTGFTAGSGVTLSLSSGQLKVANAPNGDGAHYGLSSVMTADRIYKVRFTVNLNSSGGVDASVSSGAIVFGSVNCSTNGTYEFSCIPTTTSGLNLHFVSATGAVSPRDFYIDNLSIEDVTVNGYMADIRHSTDYSPFGVQLHKRDLNLHPVSGLIAPYRYGFNDMEKDDEIKGEGNSYDFGARLYDPRVGRWLSIDPQTSKQPSFSPYKAFLNSPIIFKDPDGEDEYLVIIIKNEKTGAQLRLALPEPISNRLRAGNIRGKGYSTNIYETQNYYDYKTVFTITIGADGKTSEDIKQYTLTNSKRYTKTMFSSIVSGVRTGAIVDPDGWDLEQAGGFYMTGENGQGTKYHSKNADYVGNIDKLLSILSNYKKSPEFKISGTLTKDDPNGLWLMIGQLTKSMTKQGDIVDKTMEIVDEVKGNGGGDDSSSGDSTEVHVSSTGAVKKPGIYTYKQSNSSIKAGETPNKSNSRLIKSPQ